jgi:hypothetical protein
MMFLPLGSQIIFASMVKDMLKLNPFFALAYEFESLSIPTICMPGSVIEKDS